MLAVFANQTKLPSIVSGFPRSIIYMQRCSSKAVLVNVLFSDLLIAVNLLELVIPGLKRPLDFERTLS